jgi:hypothetical protein
MLGAGLRLLTMLLYTSAVFNYYGGDSTRYLRLKETGFTGLFSDPMMPAGYPLFLKILRALWSVLPFTIGVQHLLGLATALLLYGAIQRAGAPRWLALVPAAIVLLSGDHLFLEHALLTETLWMAFLAGGLYAAVRAVDDDRRLAWLCLAGAVLAASALVRNVSLFLPVVTAAWVALAISGDLRKRLLHITAVLVPAAILIGAYWGVAQTDGGHTGIAEMGGFNLYGRVGQFADCDRFTPPAGTRVLCEDTPPSHRSGPFFYTFSPASPMYRKFQITPGDAKTLGRFARTAILHQPLDYLKAVMKDLIRYADPEVGGSRPFSGAGPDAMSFGSLTPSQQGQSLRRLSQEYDHLYSAVGKPTVGPSRRAILEAYQTVFRLNGLELLALLAVALAGIAYGAGRARLGGLLFAACAFYLYLVPPLLSSYDVRYGVPPGDLLAAGAALGAWSVVVRRRERDQARLTASGARAGGKSFAGKV